MMVAGPSDDDVRQVLELSDLSEDQARRGLEKYGDVAALTNAYFDGNFNLDPPSTVAGPPPAPSADPPAYHQQQPSVYGPQAYQEVSQIRDLVPVNKVGPFAPPPGRPPSADIDLTVDDDPTTSRKGGSIAAADSDADLERALKMSTEQDSDFSKALELSLSDLKETDSSATNPVDSVKPEDRVRSSATPVVLRSVSPLTCILAAYLQCLYAVPTWRKAILDFKPTQTDLGSRATYANYWRGTQMEKLQGTRAASDDRVWSLIALQRLFAFMHDSHRSFVNIAEVTATFDVTSEISRPGGDPARELKSLHQTLVECLRAASFETADRKVKKQECTIEEADARKHHAVGRFAYTGTSVAAEYIRAPMAPPKATAADTVDVTSVRVRSFSSEPDDLYSAIDASLGPVLGSDGEPQSFNLLTSVPETLAFKIERHVSEVMDLDSFGSASEGKKRHVFRPLETVWLDRYHYKNRRKIAEGRKAVRELSELASGAKAARDRLALTKDGKSGVELLRSTLGYMQKAAAEEPIRAARQARLAEQYSVILAEMESKIAAHEAELASLQAQKDAIFDSDDDMKRVGPYQLCAILMRNGLNGRGSSWAVVKGDDGEWWRTSDMAMEKVKLEDALADSSGIHMDAGATMLFYQHAKFAPTEPMDIPPFLRDIALEDNHAFAQELPSSLTEAWNLPALPDSMHESPLPSPSPTLAQAAEVEHVEVIPLPEDTPASPSPVDLSLPPSTLPDVDDMQIDSALDGTPVAEFLQTPLQPTSSKMTVDGEDEVQSVTPAEPEDPLRLRGGGPDGADNDSEGSYEDEDDIDEDEVELGLLKPMPQDGTWNVDFAVGKVGGRPVYLDPTSPLAPSDVICSKCHKVMALLMQVNSPDDDRPHAAARALYVFACRTKECCSASSGANEINISSTMRIWRSQLPSPNAFYPHTEETQSRRKHLESALESNDGLSTAPPERVTPWPEWDIAAESEPYEESYLPDSITKGDEGETGTEDAAEPDTRTGVDSAFLAFQERLERVPEQVVRFYRLPDIEDPQPLWANNRKIKPEDVPPCPLCHGPRQIEFQIVSTLLNFLGDDILSFDSLLVYTCVENCDIPTRSGEKTGWAEECIIEQSFAAEGVKFNVGRSSG